MATKPFFDRAHSGLSVVTLGLEYEFDESARNADFVDPERGILLEKEVDMEQAVKGARQ